ncbi:MAG: hypothetical protein RL885_07750 [Planctomycetota bacterium]
MISRKLLLPSSLALCAALCLLAAPAHAQLCAGSDNLVGPCCTNTSITLPTFPNFSFPASSTCWSACGPASINQTIQVSAPTPLGCGSYGSAVSILDTAGNLVLSGALTLDYSRTWEETNFDGQSLQVWRFVAKADFRPGPGFDATLCQSPSCLTTIGNTAFYYGHVDYALNCVTNVFESSISLFHGCDLFIHHPIASSFPGPYHPTTSFAIVGPNTPANPFVPSLFPPFAAPAVGGATRRLGPGTSCFFEEPMNLGSLGLVGQACACPLNLGGPFQYTALQFGFNGTCNPPASSTAIGTPPPFPWIAMIAIGLGTWTGTGPGTPFPGPELVWANESFQFYSGNCSPPPSIDVDYGVMTEAGFPVSPNIERPWLTGRMLDIGSNYSRTTGIAPPFVGAVNRTLHMIQMCF